MGGKSRLHEIGQIGLQRLVDPERRHLPAKGPRPVEELDHRLGERDDRGAMAEGRERVDAREDVEGAGHEEGPHLGGDAPAGGEAPPLGLATLAGFELKAEHDVSDWLSVFALGSYVEGRDHTRDRPSRLAALIRDENFAPTGPRSLNTSKEEALPGMPPLEGRFGVRLHEAVARPNWMGR